MLMFVILTEVHLEKMNGWMEGGAEEWMDNVLMVESRWWVSGHWLLNSFNVFISENFHYQKLEKNTPQSQALATTGLQVLEYLRRTNLPYLCKYQAVTWLSLCLQEGWCRIPGRLPVHSQRSSVSQWTGGTWFPFCSAKNSWIYHNLEEPEGYLSQ